MTEAAQPLSEGVQIGIRLPVILFALVGIVLALVMMRRMGVLAGLLGAAGSLLIAIDQLVNILWVLHVNSLVKDTNVDIDRVNSVTNTYTFIDCVLITLGVALVVGSFAARKPAPPPPAPGFQVPVNPYATPQPYPQQPSPYQPPPPFPPPSPYQPS